LNLQAGAAAASLCKPQQQHCPHNFEHGTSAGDFDRKADAPAKTDSIPVARDKNRRLKKAPNISGFLPVTVTAFRSENRKRDSWTTAPREYCVRCK